ncbi:hypothetical protein JXA12_06095 [Candidatus Woesearchaeota archaeon]|nr:hypothetical protein [Candidatus Woesearchaeota archaeon]
MPVHEEVAEHVKHNHPDTYTAVSDEARGIVTETQWARERESADTAIAVHPAASNG